MGSQMGAFSDNFRQKCVQKACLKKYAFNRPIFSGTLAPPMVQKPGPVRSWQGPFHLDKLKRKAATRTAFA